MKLTLDRMCIQTGRLCTSCEDLFEKGDISDIDIDFGKILMNVAKSQRFLSNVTVTKMVETKNKVFVIVSKGDKQKFLQAGDHLTKQFSTVDSRDIVYLEGTKNVKRLIEELLMPVVPTGISTIFLPSFDEKELKIQVKKQDKENLMSTEELSVITNALLGINAHYAYN